MQRQKRFFVSARSLRQTVSVARLIRPAANSNQPTDPRPATTARRHSPVK